MSTAARFPSSPRCWRVVSPSLLPVPLLAVLSLIACGGGGVSGGGGGGGGSGNPPDFSLVIGVPNLSVQQQGAYQFQSVAAKPVNGFTGTISLSVSGLPTGITILGNIPPAGVVSGSSFQ